MTVCLDSWAVLRWLEGAEPAASQVDDVLPHRPVMSWINVGEVYYIVARATGTREARRVVAELRRRVRLDLPTEDRVLAAAAIKASHLLAYADAFALATAAAHDAVLWTGDPEILEGDPGWSTLDLRP